VYYQEGVYDQEQRDTTNLLTVEINFKDGDGDLGLDRNNSIDSEEPYNAIWYFLKDGTAVDKNISPYNEMDSSAFITFDDRSTPPYDTLPPYAPPYNCINYLVEGSYTYYFKQNLNHYNIFVDFYVKKNGQWNFYNWLTANPSQCGETYNGRFPLLNESGTTRPLEGSLKYDMVGAAFGVIFKLDTLKLQIRIQDRALHKSNMVETPEFVLRDITIN